MAIDVSAVRRALIGAAVVGVIASFASATPAAATEPFVVANGTRLEIAGDPWFLHGGSVYGTSNPGGPQSIADEISLAAGAGLNTLRIVNMFDERGIDQDAPYDEGSWSHVDQLLAAMGGAGLRAILDLSAFRNHLHNRELFLRGEQAIADGLPVPGECSGETGDALSRCVGARWCLDNAGTCSDPYGLDRAAEWDAFLASVATRENTVTGVAYRDDPTIAIVSFAGEPNPPNSGEPLRPGTQELTDFYARVFASWKASDTNHLVTSGGLLHVDWEELYGGSSGIDHEAIWSLPNQDVLSIHNYFARFPAMAANDTKTALIAEAAATVGKPWITEEFGFPQEPRDGATVYTEEDRAAWFDDVYLTQLVPQRLGPGAMVPAAGVAFWNLGPEVAPGSHDVNPGTPATWAAVRGFDASREGGPAVVQIATGGEHTCALTDRAEVWCWGSNSNGQLGHGPEIPGWRPTRVEGLPSDVVGVSAGGEFTCAVQASGSVWCWGTDQYGQLQRGGSAYNPSPGLVSGIPSDVVEVDTGAAHTCARTSGGAMWCWGYNTAGQVGNGSTSQTASPSPVVGLSSGVDEIAVGGYHTCARLDTAVKCWGFDLYGQVGDGDPMEFARPMPTDVTGLLGDVTAIASGTYHSCAIGDGLWCWGHGEFGEIGDGASIGRAAPVLVEAIADPVAITAGMNRGGGSAHTCALTPDGPRCWGSNWAGQVGDGTTIGRSEPVPVVGLPTGLRAISAGTNHTCAILASWSVKCWGANFDGALGDGTTTSRSVPVDVVWSQPDVPTAPTNVGAVAGDESATVSWTAPSSDGGSPVIGYTVTAIPGGQSVTVDGMTATATVAGLTNGTGYTFTVVATNVVGDSEPSAPSNSVTPHDIFPPSAPLDPVATAGNASATVSWQPPASDGGSSITGYSVTAAPGGQAATVDGATTTATVTGLTNGITYRFVVVATNVAGDGPPSAQSNAVTPRTVPGAPTNVAAAPGNASASVTWTAPSSNGGSSITGYTVTASPGGQTASGNANATGATVSGLTNGVTYTFTVVAVNIVGSGPPSEPSNPVTPRTVPGAPTNVVAVAGNTSATVSWWPPAADGGSSITSYTVTASTGGFTMTVPAGTLTATFNGLANGTSYRFRVRATNVAGTGPASTQSNAVVPHAAPGAPANVVAVGGNASATVTWSAAPTNGGAILSYRVTSSPGSHTVSVAGSVLGAVVPGLTNGTAYTFTVVATNDIGDGPASAPSNAVTPSAAVGRIVFASTRSGSVGADIYLMNSDGMGVVRVLSRSGNDLDPSLSPDGTKIVFVSSAGGTTELFLVKVDGSGLTQLTTNTFVDRDPSWSPDGTKIAFTSTGDGGSDTEIYVMDADGSDPVKLTDNTSTDQHPSWSPDGSQIAFTSNRVSNHEIWVMDADGSDPVRITTRAGVDQAPSWSPDGSTIAYSATLSTGNTDIFAVPASGGSPVNLTTTDGNDFSPAWSPDGLQIAFHSNRPGSAGYDIYRMGANGGGVVRLTAVSGDDSAPDW